jgi:septal ring factor EnvC (AmiA/AmiB activator)
LNVNDRNVGDELAVARSAVEQLACAGDLPADTASALGDIVRLIDAFVGHTEARFDGLNNEIGALKTDLHRLQDDVHRLEDAANAANADSHSLRAEMRGFDRLEKMLDQSVSSIVDRMTALEARS